MAQKQPYIIMVLITVIFSVFTAGYLVGKVTSNDVPYSENDEIHFANDTTNNVVVDYKININQASAEELMQLDGIGEELSSRIIIYRNNNGPFAEIEDIMNVKGIGPKTFDKIAELITIGG